MLHPRLVVFLFLSVPTAASFAQPFAALSQTRYVDSTASAQGTGGDPGTNSPYVAVHDSQSAPGFDAFVATADAAAPWSITQLGIPRSGLIHASANQHSNLSANQIVANGSSYAERMDSVSLQASGHGISTSFFEVTFLLTTQTLVHVVADLSVPSFDGVGTAKFLFEGPDVHFDEERSFASIYSVMPPGPNTYHTDEILALLPGTYTLRASANSTPPSYRTSPMTASFSLRLTTVPEPTAVVAALSIAAFVGAQARLRRGCR